MPVHVPSPTDETATTAPSATLDAAPFRRWLGPASLAATTIVWAWMIRDAWRLRSVVARYESTYGTARWSDLRWPAHLQTLHDELLAVGADYYYPFGFGIIAAVGLCWLASAVLATTPTSRIRRSLLCAGLISLPLQLLIFGSTLGTYVAITD
ncbi:MAG: hypothetical protein AAF467_25505 [Actinomycetota bacterium]